MLQRGRGVQEGDAEAVGWFRKSAWQWSRGAQTALGIVRERGRGVHKDAVRSLAWNDLAAEQASRLSERFGASIGKDMSDEQLAAAQWLEAE